MKQVIIAGNITKDAITRTTPSGDKVTGFSVAVNDRNNNATFFGCSLWGKRGEALCQYLTKGSAVAVVGDLSTREHDGKTYLDVRVSEVTLQGGRKNTREEYSNVGGGPDLDDDLPFAMEWRL